MYQTLKVLSAHQTETTDSLYIDTLSFLAWGAFSPDLFSSVRFVIESFLARLTLRCFEGGEHMCLPHLLRSLRCRVAFLARLTLYALFEGGDRTSAPLPKSLPFRASSCYVGWTLLILHEPNECAADQCSSFSLRHRVIQSLSWLD